MVREDGGGEEEELFCLKYPLSSTGNSVNRLRMLKRGGSIFTVLPLTAYQKLLMIYHFSLLGGNVCMREKKDSAFPVLKYSYQNSSVSD